jgi:hypothetical protein
MRYTNLGTFIGPPGLERETRIRESPVPVPTGTTTGPREEFPESSITWPRDTGTYFNK